MTTRDTHRQGEEIAKAPSAMVDEELQTAKVTLAGAGDALTFDGLGLEDMADTSYRVAVHGEFAGTVSVDESTIAETGFSLVGGAASEVAHIWVHGKIGSRKRF